MKKQIKEYLSKCCKAEVKISIAEDFIGDKITDDYIGTCNYFCSKCDRPCDIYVEKNKKKKIQCPVCKGLGCTERKHYFHNANNCEDIPCRKCRGNGYIILIKEK